MLGALHVVGDGAYTIGVTGYNSSAKFHDSALFVCRAKIFQEFAEFGFVIWCKFYFILRNNEEVILPLVAADSRTARPIAEGALMRLSAGARCFRSYRAYFGLD